MLLLLLLLNNRLLLLVLLLLLRHGPLVLLLLLPPRRRIGRLSIRSRLRFGLHLVTRLVLGSSALLCLRSSSSLGLGARLSFHLLLHLLLLLLLQLSLLHSGLLALHSLSVGDVLREIRVSEIGGKVRKERRATHLSLLSGALSMSVDGGNIG